MNTLGGTGSSCGGGLAALLPASSQISFPPPESVRMKFWRGKVGIVGKELSFVPHTPWLHDSMDHVRVPVSKGSRNCQVEAMWSAQRCRERGQSLHETEGNKRKLMKPKKGNKMRNTKKPRITKKWINLLKSWLDLFLRKSRKESRRTWRTHEFDLQKTYKSFMVVWFGLAGLGL